MLHRGYKYRAYPSAEQQQLLRQTFGCCRYVWNQYLDYRSREKKKPAAGWLSELRQREESVWLQDVPAVALYQVARDLDEAYVAFFKRNSKYPKFKSKHRSRRSARFQIHEKDLIVGQPVKLVKVGALDVRWHRPLPDGAEARMATVSEDSAGRWWISLNVRYPEPAVLPNLENAVGIDLGLTHLATLSTGEKIVNPRHERTDRARLARAQRALSKKEKGSNNREKARKQVARAHARITDRRVDSLHKLTSRLIRENQTICLEDLNVSGMVRSHTLARAISDASWSTLVYLLEYKAEEAGRQIVKVNRWCPSSKTCSACGHLLASLPLGVREWTCPACGVIHDRDVNAAQNIRTVGLTGLVCGADVRPDEQELARQTALKQKVSA